MAEANLVAATPGKQTSSLVNGLFHAEVRGAAMSAVNGQEQTYHLKAVPGKEASELAHSTVRRLILLYDAAGKTRLTGLGLGRRC